MRIYIYIPHLHMCKCVQYYNIRAYESIFKPVPPQPIGTSSAQHRHRRHIYQIGPSVGKKERKQKQKPALANGARSVNPHAIHAYVASTSRRATGPIYRYAEFSVLLKRTQRANDRRHRRSAWGQIREFLHTNRKYNCRFFLVTSANTNTARISPKQAISS